MKGAKTLKGRSLGENPLTEKPTSYAKGLYEFLANPSGELSPGMRL